MKPLALLPLAALLLTSCVTTISLEPDGSYRVDAIIARDPRAAARNFEAAEHLATLTEPQPTCQK